MPRKTKKSIWDEDSNHPREDWKAEVVADETLMGYWDWVRNKRTLEEALEAEES